MSFLPTPVSTAARTRLLGYAHAKRASAPAAGGEATAAFDPVPERKMWLVDRASVQCDSAAATGCSVYVGAARDDNLVDGTTAGNLDVADLASPWLVEAGDQLQFVWTGASPGAIGIARIQYREFEVG